ncbi:hypothetical protein CV657_05500 [Borreliella burgdorferi]|uniref:ENTH domain-containing protein n=2 Tax=Borreliella burgdorferi TaxID=139 RepID=G5IXH1_BORBU|nr:hypothetical protein BBU64B_H0009 [Borreliella burgdorferi 64b]ACN56251.1 hypothetical protein BBUCA112A_H0006 [Borreliella burgdorferi CA-11.2A]AET25417.1 hypothetical protein BB_H0042 [Borreliella burgdorferi B31]PNL81675.1 hypothetical protein A6J35_006825 [Borreliella burgdorferi]PRQ97948.1 hypothetical protein CV681_05090 [Borreliella burgdorferi]
MVLLLLIEFKKSSLPMYLNKLESKPQYMIKMIWAINLKSLTIILKFLLESN